jgi:hypothetical protein
MIRIIFVLIVSIVPATAFAQSSTVFRGLPVAKVSEAGDTRVPEVLTRDKAVNFKCVISKIGDSYYWASRENARLLISESGAFITYVAENGSGYVRVVNPNLKEAASMMSETEAKYDYVEHLLIGLRSVSYYGVRD